MHRGVKAAPELISVQRHTTGGSRGGGLYFSVGAASGCEGPTMLSVLHGASAVGGRAGVQGPDGFQGNICSAS